ncbi:MAG: type II toxin-antitoxin system VapC family toxin [Candidatus Bathyarchaeota archaeon]|nr:type II toxin-antitoxin system VapC family toxin [Candidatus Bathyarchaeota archaeon]MDH5732818.1 type II toxin-antitoxin system VapC family toxin [Candidatus Bathyarchaeota archaeon]
MRKRLRRGKVLAVCFIDSNVFFYAKIFDREYGEACAGVLGKIEKGELEAVTSTLVVVELTNALRKYGLSDEVKDVVDAVFSLDMRVFEVDSIDVRTAAGIFDEFRVSPYDCVHAAVMKKAGVVDIISADRDFDKIEWIKRRDPKFI